MEWRRTRWVKHLGRRDKPEGKPCNKWGHYLLLTYTNIQEGEAGSQVWFELILLRAGTSCGLQWK
jgi:hypothetical protein